MNDCCLYTWVSFPHLNVALIRPPCISAIPRAVLGPVRSSDTTVVCLGRRAKVSCCALTFFIATNFLKKSSGHFFRFQPLLYTKSKFLINEIIYHTILHKIDKIIDIKLFIYAHNKCAEHTYKMVYIYIVILDLYCIKSGYE